MILFIDTSLPEHIVLEIKDDKGARIKIKKIKAARQQAEKLLPGIEKILADNGKGLKSLKKIQVAVNGKSFTSLRIGVVTANALAYSLNIPVIGMDESGAEISEKKNKKFKDYNIVSPRYDREPNIGKSNKKPL